MAQLMPITAQMRAANAGQSLPASVAKMMPQPPRGSDVGVALSQWKPAPILPQSSDPSSVSRSSPLSQSSTTSCSSSQRGSPLHDPYGGSSALFDAPEAKFADSAADLAPATFVDLSKPTSTASVCLGALDKTEKAALHGRGHAPWSADEDAALMVHVRELGQVWRKIAGLLPGRTDDAVRNRWLRLSQLGVGDKSVAPGENTPCVKVEPSTLSAPTDHQLGHYSAPPARPPKAKPKVAKATGGVGGKFWTPEEDETIVSLVASVGTKWGKIAEQLPGRIPHATRHRYERLMMKSKQLQAQVGPTTATGKSPSNGVGS